MRNRRAPVNFLEKMHRTTPLSKVTWISTGAAVRQTANRSHGNEKRTMFGQLTSWTSGD